MRPRLLCHLLPNEGGKQPIRIAHRVQTSDWLLHSRYANCPREVSKELYLAHRAYREEEASRAKDQGGPRPRSGEGDPRGPREGD